MENIDILAYVMQIIILLLTMHLNYSSAQYTLLFHDDMEDIRNTGWDETGSTNPATCQGDPCGFAVGRDSMITWNGISTEGYHGIKLDFSITPHDVEGQDYCEVFYSINGTDFISLKTYGAEFEDDRQYDTLYMNTNADNQASLSLRFETIGYGTQGEDYCVIHDVFVRGILGTRSPTSYPTYHPTTQSLTFEPSMEPTADPTTYPTKEPTLDPTTDPTGNPTRQPTEYPTSAPFPEPSLQPTRRPIDDQLSIPMSELHDDPTTELPISSSIDMKTDEFKRAQSIFSDDYLMTNWYYLVLLGFVLLCCLFTMIICCLRPGTHSKSNANANCDEQNVCMEIVNEHCNEDMVETGTIVTQGFPPNVLTESLPSAANGITPLGSECKEYLNRYRNQ